MTWAAIGAAAASEVIGQMGQKGQGAAAPAPNVGGLLCGNKLGSSPEAQAMSQLAQQGNYGNPIQDAVQGAPFSVQPDKPIGQIDETGAAGPSIYDMASQNNFGGGPDQGKGGLGGFFGNLDKTLGSQSKTLGIGLLGELDPRLALGGLLAGGLFGQNKLFGRQ